MKLVAHRGYYGDNTLDSFKKAIECGKFHALEMDIQLDEYNHIIIKHDLHLGQNEPKLYLKDFFNHVVVPKHIKIFFDIKGSSNIVPFLELFFKNKNLEQYIFCSFNIKTLKKFKLPVVQGLITSNSLRKIDLDFILDKRMRYLVIDWNFLDNEIVYYCKTHNICIYTFTIHTNTELEYIKTFNIEGSMVDHNCVLSSSKEEK